MGDIGNGRRRRREIVVMEKGNGNRLVFGVQDIHCWDVTLIMYFRFLFFAEFSLKILTINRIV